MRSLQVANEASNSAMAYKNIHRHYLRQFVHVYVPGLTGVYVVYPGVIQVDCLLPSMAMGSVYGNLFGI